MLISLSFPIDYLESREMALLAKDVRFADGVTLNKQLRKIIC